MRRLWITYVRRFVSTLYLYVVNEQNRNIIEVSDEEKALFTEWLTHRQLQLIKQLETVQSLVLKLHGELPAHLLAKPELASVRVTVASDEDQPRWAEKAYKIMKDFARPMTSAEIVDHLMKTDSYSANIPRVEVMRGISTRLNQLVKRGQAKKEFKEDGKLYYEYLEKNKATL